MHLYRSIFTHLFSHHQLIMNNYGQENAKRITTVH